MHDYEFSQVFTPPRFIVLGLPLERLTIGHELLLWNRQNPVVQLTAYGFKQLPIEEKGRALAEAVQIVYNDKDEKAKKLFDNSKGWIRKAVALDLDKEIDAFYSYRDICGKDLPTVKQPRAKDVPFHYFGAPEVARLINYVSNAHSAMIQAHFEGSPLNFPLGLARMLYSTHLETEGAIWVENWQDLEQKRRKEAFEKEHPENTLAVGEEAVKASAEKWNKEHPECPVTVN